MQGTGRAILVQVVVLIVVLAAAALAVDFWYQGQNFVTSSDAQVTAPLAPVGSLAAGILTTWNVKTGDTVTAGETLGTVTPAVRPAGVGAAPAASATVEITSPFGGTVVSSDAVAGATVAPGAALAYVADLRAPAITAYVKETKIRDVAAGQRVDATIDAFPGTTFAGSIRSVGLVTAGTFSLLPSASPGGTFTKVTQRIPVVIRLDAPLHGLLPGESATVKIHIR
ncbi:MAG TPA: efflux RND transporter periplasmic adaptor subunit [Bacillota bacterium]|nr:efflux RND transporter periplasmic adaptor subunit [Bacillota bacterium]